MTRKKLLVTLFCSLFLFTGCDDSSVTDATRDQEQESVRFSGQTVSGVQDKLERTAQILASVAPNHDAFNSIRKAMVLREKQGYAEDVSFAHLLMENPEVKNKMVRSTYASINKPFRAALDAHQEKSGGSSTSAFGDELQSFLINKGITVAWMHRDNFETLPEAPTVTFYPLEKTMDNPDDPDVTSIGFKPVDGERGGEYTRVEVDGDYLKNNPTLVVRPCEAGLVEGPVVNNFCEIKQKNTQILEPCLQSSLDKCGGGGGGGGGGSTSSYKAPESADKFEVYIDDFQCAGGDTDGPFAGGPEIRFYQVEPDVSSTDPDQDAVKSVTYIDSFSDSDCDNYEWQSIGSTWDGLWESMDSENGILVADHDDLYSGDASFSLGYDGTIFGVDVNGSADINFSYGNDDPWGKFNIARYAFVRDGQVDNSIDCNGNGTRDGKCIRGIGTLGRFTFGSNVLND